VKWRPEWNRFQTWEYVATAAVLGTGFYLRFGTGTPPDNFRGGVLFDEPLIDRAALENRGNRRFVKTMTDVLYQGSLAFRIVDSTLLPGVMHGAWDVGWQMTLIDIEAFSAMSLTFFAAQALVGRERPLFRRCGDPAYRAKEPDCESGDNYRFRSLIAGHAATGLTVAALTCVHHSHIPLYGRDGDILACGLMLGAGLMNGMGRVVTERHYPTDFALAIGVAGATGFLLPTALHYGFGGKRPVAQRRSAERALAVRVTPLVSESELGLQLLGIH
jgi:hypothetical protein